jgi:hypothetical protein
LIKIKYLTKNGHQISNIEICEASPNPVTLAFVTIFVGVFRNEAGMPDGIFSNQKFQFG